MSEFRLQVGDLIRQPRDSVYGETFYEISVEKRFLWFVKFDKWHTEKRVWNAILKHPDITTVHRPVADKLVQIWPPQTH